MKMESLKLEQQKSLEGENDMTTQDLQSLLQYEAMIQNKGRDSKSSYKDEFEEDKYQDTEKIALQQNAPVDENAQTSKLFASEKAKFKQDLMQK